MSAARRRPGAPSAISMTDPKPAPDSTHFGYENVPWSDKARRVLGFEPKFDIKATIDDFLGLGAVALPEGVRDGGERQTAVGGA